MKMILVPEKKYDQLLELEKSIPQQVGTKSIEGGTLTYNNDQKTRNAVWAETVGWFIIMHAFDGESVRQNDGPQMDAPDFLAMLADKLFEFNVQYEDE